MPFDELKQRQGAMWGSGPFERIEETIADMHDELIARLGVNAGEKWLDVGSGTGAVAERAARGGAHVAGVDLAPKLVETARRRAVEHGLEIDYAVVSSSVGVMFAPDHAATARELAPVVRPGGRLGLTAWRADGRVGNLFRAMAPFQPAPFPDAGRPLDWGAPEHVRDLLGASFELEFHEAVSVHAVPSAQESWELFSTAFGPIVSALARLDLEGREQLRRTYLDLLEADRGDHGQIRQERVYTLVLGRRR